MKISIIVPVYNTEKYLSECLNSLIAQTYSGIEILCVDDCSTDGSSQTHVLFPFFEQKPRNKLCQKGGGYAVFGRLCDVL